MPARLRTGVLVGGASRRMGQPKQLIRLADGYLIDSVVSVLGSVSEPVLIGDGDVPAHLVGLTRVVDATNFNGPLAGVVGALLWDPEAAWLIAACDQPWVTSPAIHWLLDQRLEEAVAVMPRDAARPQPFPGIYEPTCHEVILSSSPAAISDLADHPRVQSPRIQEAMEPAWVSVNQPADLAGL